MGKLATKLRVSLERHCARDMVINVANQKQLLKEMLYKVLLTENGRLHKAQSKLLRNKCTNHE